MKDVATIASPQAAHRRMYEPRWTIASVLSNPHEGQAKMSFICSRQGESLPFRRWSAYEAAARIMAMTSSIGPIHLKWRTNGGVAE